MIARLDFLFEEEIRQETEFECTFALFEKQTCIYSLCVGHEHIQMSEIAR